PVRSSSLASHPAGQALGQSEAYAPVDEPALVDNPSNGAMRMTALDGEGHKRERPRLARPETRVLAAAIAVAVVAAGVAVGSRFIGRARGSAEHTVGPRPHLAGNGLIAFSGGRSPGSPFTPSNLFVVNPDGSKPRQLTHDDLRRSSIAWSPDGTRIAYVQTGGEFPPWNIFIASADGREVKQ